ncbi:MAG: DNA mismatch repair endonuclease MutL [Candidatus Omnitrophica bacterium]|nr:DNA mismatch repair endonuclease MutL [Candidatus Omnitrophota bacterium]
MSKVKILPSEIVSKIAAGEVIDRPASVIKECVENALDAKASQIEVHLQNAGKTSMVIKDNGQGIAQDDLENIFIRHATSKITTIDDLYAIMSLGFRGEALYSIGAIADIVVQSRTQDQNPGWEIHFRGGEKIGLKPCARPSTGTEMIIRELFFNTPARKKFLKTNTTELHQILNTFIPYTLLHTDCQFTLTHQNRTLISLKTTDSFVTRAADALNVNPEYLLETNQRIDKESLAIRMVLGDINIQRSRRDMQFLFINGRPVQNKSISYHINNIYRLIMPDSVYPFFAIYIEMNPEEIDVNIHPTKREVKIRTEKELSRYLRTICEQALMRAGQTKQVSVDLTKNNFSSARSASSDTTKALTSTHTPAIDYDSKTFSSDDAYSALSSGIESYPHTLPHSQPEKRTSPHLKHHPDPRKEDQASFFYSKNNTFSQHSNSFHAKLEQAGYIGSFLNKYLLFQSQTSLLLMDQHAAQERITYEILLHQMQKGTVEAQHLLSPVLVKLSPQEMIVWEEVQMKLKEIGFENHQFDPAIIAIDTHPVLIKNIEQAVRHLLAGDHIGQCDFDSIARRACRSSIMAGDRLKPEQAQHQCQQLLHCLDPFTCPHGRPTVIEMDEQFLDKQFKRIQ